MEIVLESQDEATMDCEEDENMNDCENEEYKKELDCNLINTGDFVLAQF